MGIENTQMGKIKYMDDHEFWDTLFAWAFASITFLSIPVHLRYSIMPVYEFGELFWSFFAKLLIAGAFWYKYNTNLVKSYAWWKRKFVKAYVWVFKNKSK